MSQSALVVAGPASLPKFALNPVTIEAKRMALENAALIGKVTDRDSKIIAVRAQMDLKKLLNELEKARTTLKEPILKAGRELDNLVALESLALDQEFGRVSNVVKEFDDAERRRVLEEERLQREELERIEREKQAELRRIAEEQLAREREAARIQQEADRKAREEREAAERIVREAAEKAAALAREATNKKQREAAEKARLEAVKQAKEAQEAANRRAETDRIAREAQEEELAKKAAESAAQVEAIESKAGDAAYVASRPVEITKVQGQRTSTNWIITVEQPFVLAKFHPDLVDIKPRLGDIKNALNEGREVKGIKAVRETVSSVRVKPDRKAIDV